MGSLPLRAVLVTIALGACNSVYGLGGELEETKPVDFDFDQDGVGNTDDNCPTMANADQADSDGDGIGDVCDPCPQDASASTVDADHDGVYDVCDPCPLGPQHDEDNDGVFDACDNCPATVNPTQDNEDGDALGDACDTVGNGAQTRALFDGFATISDDWHRGVLWKSEQDAAEPRVDLGLTENYEMEYTPHQLTNATNWAITASITGEFTTSGPVEIRLIEPGPNPNLYTCGISNNGGTAWRLKGGGSSVVIPDPGLTAVVRERPFTATQMNCELVGTPYNVVFPSPPGPILYPLTIAVFSQAEHGGFNYIDVVE